MLYVILPRLLWSLDREPTCTVPITRETAVGIKSPLSTLKSIEGRVIEKVSTEYDNILLIQPYHSW